MAELSAVKLHRCSVLTSNKNADFKACSVSFSAPQTAAFRAALGNVRKKFGALTSLIENTFYYSTEMFSSSLIVFRLFFLFCPVMVATQALNLQNLSGPVL